MSNRINSPDFDLDAALEENVSTELAQILTSAVKEWNDAQNADALITASNNFSPSIIMSQIQSLISSVELWYMSEHNSVITIKAKDLGLSPSRWLIQASQSKWLHQEVSPSLNSLQHLMAQFDTTIEAFAIFAKNNSGVSGFVRNFIQGANNPIDAALSLFGAGSGSAQVQELEKRLEKSQSSMVDGFVALDETITSAIRNAIHSKTGASLTEMEHAAEEERQRRSSSSVQVSSSVPFSGGGSRRIKGRYILALTAVLILAVVLYLRHGTSQSKPPTASVAIINPTTPHKGPGDQFEALPAIAQPEAAAVLDRSVEGWCKVRFSDGHEAWVKSERVLFTSPNAAP